MAQPRCDSALSLTRPRPLALTALVAGLALSPAGVTRAADGFSTSDYLTGGWGGTRERWAEAGFRVNLNYTTESMANVAGGEVLGGTYADNIALDIHLDLARLLGVPNTTLLIKGSQRDGASVSERFIAPSVGGNTFTVQELYGGQNAKLANVQFNTRLLDDRLDLAYGRLIANDDFLRSDLYCQFVNNSFCGSPKPVFLQNPFTFTAYPLATWGARLRYDTPAKAWTLQLAVYDGDPELKRGDPASPGHNDHGTNWGIGDNGVTIGAEVHYHVNRDSKTALPGVYKLGGFYLTGDFQDLAAPGAVISGNGMVWLLADQMLYRPEAGSDRGLSAFGAAVFTLTDAANQMSEYVSAGLVYAGLFAARPRDKTGFAASIGWYGDALNDGRCLAGLPAQSYEAVLELNHKFMLGHGIAFQPDVQYVIRPSGTGLIDNALAVGAKVSIDF